MGSSSSKPHYYHERQGDQRTVPTKVKARRNSSSRTPLYPTRNGATGYPPMNDRGQYAPRLGVEPQFGYFVRQLGSDPTDVEMIPGYYYPVTAQTAGKHSSKDQRYDPKREGSVPTLSATLAVRHSVDNDMTRPSNTASASYRAPRVPPPPPPTPAALASTMSSPSEAPANPTASVPAAPHSAPPQERINAVDPVSPSSPAPTSPNPTRPPMPTSSSSQRSKNPLPKPPANILNDEKFKNLRRHTVDTVNTSAPPARPPASRNAVSDPSSNAQPSNKESTTEANQSPVPFIPPPTEGSNTIRPALRNSSRRRETSPSERALPRSPDRSGGNNSFNILRSLTTGALARNRTESKKLKRNPQPEASSDPDYTGYPHPIPAPKYPNSSGRIPVYTPSPMDFPVDTGEPFVFYLHSNLNPASPHKVLYQRKLYPTAAHLFEAHKFLKYKPELAERIRVCSESASEMSQLSWEFQMSGHVREDWELVWREKLDEVLYLMVTQHPNLRAELMATGYAQLLDGNEVRHRGVVDAPGVNELGKGLMRLRERLRREGSR